MRRPALALLVAAALLVLAAAASAIPLRAGDIIVNADGGFAPKALPRHKNAPITIHGGGRISTVSGELPPILETIELEFDRHGALDTEGLPICTRARLEATTVAQARRSCPDSIVGTGHGHAIVKFPEQGPIPADSPITLFNGPRVCTSASIRQPRPSDAEQPHARTREGALATGSGGHAAFIQDQRLSDPQSQSDSFWGSLDRPFDHARGEHHHRAQQCDASVIAHAFTTVPAPTTFIVPIVIERIHKGTYGYRTKARIPRIANGYGVPISGSLKIGRKWTYRGVQHSYVSARCETGRLQARGQFSFSDHTNVSGTFLRPCQVRK